MGACAEAAEDSASTVLDGGASELGPKRLWNKVLILLGYFSSRPDGNL